MGGLGGGRGRKWHAGARRQLQTLFPAGASHRADPTRGRGLDLWPLRAPLPAPGEDLTPRSQLVSRTSPKTHPAAMVRPNWSCRTPALRLRADCVYAIVTPPSATTTVPVMNEAAFDARNATM